MGEVRFLPSRRDVDLAGVTELRVHGVGGTTPEQLLEDPHPYPVAGDERLSAFYRTQQGGRWSLEAYSWGGLTSRSGTRVLWILLLPFTLGNLAGWMYGPSRPAGGQPASEGAPGTAGAGGTVEAPWGGEPPAFRAMVRLFNLTLTVAAVLWLYTIIAFMLAYQCGGQPGCTASRPWLAWLTTDAFAAFPLRRMALGSMVVLVAMALVGVAVYRSLGRYEHHRVDDGLGGKGQPGDLQDRERARSTGGLRSPLFWQGEPLVRRLGALHLVGAVGTLTLALAVSAGSLPGASDGLVVPVGVAGSLLVLLAVVGVVFPHRLPGGGMRGWLGAAVLGLVVAVVFFRSDVAGSTRPRELAGLIVLGGLAGLVQLALLVGLAAWLGWRALRERLRRVPRQIRGYRWGGPVVALTLAGLSLHAFLAGTAVRVADFHATLIPRGTDAAGLGAEPYILYPQDWDVLAFMLLALVVLAGLILGILWVLRWRCRRPLVAEIEEDYKAEMEAVARGDRPIPDGWTSQLEDGRTRDRWIARTARWRVASSVVDDLDLVLTGVATLALIAAVLLAVLRLEGGLAEPLTLRGRNTSLGWVWTASTWVMSLVPFGAMLAMRAAYRSETMRRKIGILWDVGTFWPRLFHPLAPPAYAERAVPELRDRLCRLTTAPRGRVVLSAHSQGSVLAAAALLQLDGQGRGREVLSRVTLVTYGCPLLRLYGKFFPAYLGPDVLSHLHTALASARSPTAEDRGWRNFWVWTDLIGGPALPPGRSDDGQRRGSPDQGTVDRRLWDPASSFHQPGDPPPRVGGHSCYLNHPDMTAYVARLAQEPPP